MFWTLQVRVVILDDEVYHATWYTMDGLSRKRYIHTPILIDISILWICFRDSKVIYCCLLWPSIIKLLEQHSSINFSITKVDNFVRGMRSSLLFRTINLAVSHGWIREVRNIMDELFLIHL
jgi:hypothetical protein